MKLGIKKFSGFWILDSEFLIIILTLLLSSCAAVPEIVRDASAPQGTYALIGKTRYQGEPLPSGEIILMRAEPGGRVHRTGIGPEGNFELDLAPGPYFLMGWGSDPGSGESLFAFWINNPVRLYEDVTEPVALPFVRSTEPPRTVQGEGISGRVLFNGKPVEGAIVAAFLDATGEFHGLPFADSSPTGVDGRYLLNLETGRYYLLARQRTLGGTFQGPMLKGDLSGFYPHNPVILRNGQGIVLDIPMVEVNRPRGEGSLAHGETIVISGKVKDITGAGVPGVRVVLYTIPEMLGRPMFISSPTDLAGSYRLEVSRGGKFYLAARSVIGRPPKTGELMGYYDVTEDHSILLEMGDRVGGVDIVVREVW